MGSGSVFRNEIRGAENVFQADTINLRQRSPVPLDLCSDPHYWTNHAELLEYVLEWLALPSPTPLVIKGPKHAGKSALVGVAVCRSRRHLPDGVLHLEPGKNGVQAELIAALERLDARRISEVPGAADKHYKSLMADLRTLVVIDEPRNKGDIEAFWPEGTRGHCIVLTSKELHWIGAREVELPPLAAEHALELLGKVGDCSPEVNRAIVGVLGGFPGNLLRAVGIMAAGDIDVAKLVDLADAHADQALFLKAFDQVSPDAKRLYRALCALPDPVFERAMLDWLDRVAPEGERPVGELEDYRLIYEVGPGMWRVQHSPEGVDVGGPND